MSSELVRVFVPVGLCDMLPVVLKFASSVEKPHFSVFCVGVLFCCVYGDAIKGVLKSACSIWRRCALERPLRLGR